MAQTLKEYFLSTWLMYLSEQHRAQQEAEKHQAVAAAAMLAKMHQHVLQQ